MVQNGDRAGENERREREKNGRKWRMEGENEKSEWENGRKLTGGKGRKGRGERKKAVEKEEKKKIKE